MSKVLCENCGTALIYDREAVCPHCGLVAGPVMSLEEEYIPYRRAAAFRGGGRLIAVIKRETGRFGRIFPFSIDFQSMQEREGILDEYHRLSARVSPPRAAETVLFRYRRNWARMLLAQTNLYTLSRATLYFVEKKWLPAPEVDRRVALRRFREMLSTAQYANDDDAWAAACRRRRERRDSVWPVHVYHSEESAAFIFDAIKAGRPWLKESEKVYGKHLTNDAVKLLVEQHRITKPAVEYRWFIRNIRALLRGGTTEREILEMYMMEVLE